MRPRSSDRGELVPAGQGRLQSAHASMRPRSSDRGERGAAGPACASRSPGFNAATVFGPWRTADVPATTVALTALQCGHGLRTVENNHRPSGPPAWARRFNAATVFGPWRTSVKEILGDEWTCFNAATVFGPWRTHHVAAEWPGSGLASMRPRSSDRGELDIPVQEPFGILGFNAATVFGPWRTAPWA